MGVEGFDEVDPRAGTAHVENEREADDVKEGIDADAEINKVASAFNMGEDSEVEEEKRDFDEEDQRRIYSLDCINSLRELSERPFTLDKMSKFSVPESKTM